MVYGEVAGGASESKELGGVIRRSDIFELQFEGRRLELRHEHATVWEATTIDHVRHMNQPASSTAPKACLGMWFCGVFKFCQPHDSEFVSQSSRGPGKATPKCSNIQHHAGSACTEERLLDGNNTRTSLQSLYGRPHLIWHACAHSIATMAVSRVAHMVVLYSLQDDNMLVSTSHRSRNDT